MSELEIEFTEEELEKLREGEQLQVCTQIRESFTGDVPTSINALKIQLTTKGAMADFDSPEDLVEFFDEVEGVEEKLKEEGYL